MIGLEGMAQRSIHIDFVDVVTTLPAPDYVSGINEIAHDAMNRSLTDSNHLGDLCQPHHGVLSDTKQHVGVVGQKGPAGVHRILGSF